MNATATENTFRKCVGCGFCCLKSPCVYAIFTYNIRVDQRCPSLEWDGKRYVCMIGMMDDDVREILAIGEGCCCPMNTWRNDVRERK